MQKEFVFGKTTIPYILHYADIKIVKITVEFEHGVEVTAPNNISDAQLEVVIRKKAPWIIEKISSFQFIKDVPSAKEFLSGEKFLYLGRSHQLIIEENAVRKPYATMRQQNLIVTVSPNLQVWQRHEEIYNALRKWYQREAKKNLKKRTQEYSQKLNIVANDIQVIDMLRRWGSCSPKGIINYNWKIVMAPMYIIDYLVVHELCHIRIPDHSEEYWQLLHSFMPDYEDRREWLRINGPTLIL